MVTEGSLWLLDVTGWGWWNLIIGILLAFLLRAIVVRIVRTIERVIPGFSYRTSFAGLAKERRISDIVGAVVFWAVLLFFLATAADALGVPLLSGAVASLSLLVPRVLVAVLIVALFGVARSTSISPPGGTMERTETTSELAEGAIAGVRLPSRRSLPE
mgnify:CR=1 FL=1